MDDEIQRAFDDVRTTRRDDEERLRKVEREMVSGDQLQERLDRSTEPVLAQLSKLDAALSTITLSMVEVPLQAQRIMALEKTSTDSAGVSGRTLGTIIGGLIATLVACGAAVKNYLGGD